MRIAITRPKERSDETVKAVGERGWEALVVSAIEIVPRSKGEIIKGVGDIAGYDWLVLTSAYGAEIMLKHFGGKLKKLHIAAIGPKTKNALEKACLNVSLIPEEYETEGLLEELVKHAKGKRILVARAAMGREILVEELKKAAKVVEVPLYDTVLPRDKASIVEFSDALENKELDAVVFTSSQTVKNLFDYLGGGLARDLEGVRVCAIGPQTALTLEQRGVRVDIVPREYTLEACLDALEKRSRTG